MAPATDLRIALFGELSVRRRGRCVVAGLPGRQGRALLAYLVLNHHRAVDRDELLDVLWSESPPADPDAALSSVLAKVRRAVGPDLITGRRALTLALAEEADVDVQNVVARIEQAECSLAEREFASALCGAGSSLSLLAQPLLPGLQGDWVDEWRRHFDALRPRALEAAARAALALGGDHLAHAERAASALVEIQPFRESAYAWLMQAQARRGDVPEAMRTFERLRTLLRDELGTTPSPEFVELHGKLLHEGAAALPAPSPCDGLPLPGAVARSPEEGAFVGRASVLQQMRAAWDAARTGESELVILLGEPGVGKTRVASHFAAEVHAAGAKVLYGRADEDALLPHQPFVEALRPLLAADLRSLSDEQRDLLSRLSPDLCPAGAPAEASAETLRYRLFQAVVDVLGRATGRSPVLLLLDDLHWADQPTLLLLRHLMRSPGLGGLLVVATARDADLAGGSQLNDALVDIRRDRSFVRIRLAGLEESETEQLIASRLGHDVTPGFVTRLCEQTAGNAFFIGETLRALIASDLPATVGEGSLDTVGVPDGVADVILRRVRGLSPLASDALVAAAVAGRRFRLDVVEQLVDAGSEELIVALEESIAAGLVCELSDAVDVFAFAHAVVRDVLYRQLTASRRVRLHHRVAQALERLAEQEAINPAELAHHFRIAQHRAGTEPARRYAVAAGAQACERLAHEEAAGHYRRALELFGDGEEAERCEVLLALGRVQWHIGDAGARSTFVKAAESAGRRGDAEQLARAALGLGERWFEIDYAADARHRELLEEAVIALPGRDSALRALVLARLAQHIGFPTEDERALSVSRDALAMARRTGDGNAVTTALLARYVTLGDVRHLDERLGLMDELARVDGAHRELAAEHHHWRLYDFYELGDLAAARGEHARLDAIAAELRQPLLCSMATGWRGLAAELAGDTELAAVCAAEGLRKGRRAHMQDALSTWAAKLFSARHRDDRVRDAMPTIVALAGGAGRDVGWPSALALLRLEAGDEAAARATYERELSGGVCGVPRGLYWLTTMALLSELCARLGDAGRAEALYEALAPYAHRNVVVGYASCWGPVESYLAYLADAFGDRRLAAGHLRSALVRTRAMGAPLLTAALEARSVSLACI